MKTPTVGQQLLVRKLDYATGRVMISWPGRLLELSDERLVIRAPFASSSGNTVFVDGVPFAPGDIFTEFYFLHRWYNVFHIAGPTGQPKGWYCNVTRPATLDESGVSFVDLALDLFAHPDGRYTVLDEDEFDLAREQAYASEDANQALAAIDQLKDLARAGRLPIPDDVV